MLVDFFNLLHLDYRITMSYKSGRFKIARFLLSPSFMCVFLYRLSHLFLLLHIPILPRIFWWLNFLIFNVDIDHRARLYCGCYFPHPIGIVIGDKVEAFGYIKLLHNVTLGGNLGKKRKIDKNYIFQPKIDGCLFVGPNSVIIGPVKIEGKNFIATNSVLSLDCYNKLVQGNNVFFELNQKHIDEIYCNDALLHK